MRLTLLIIEHDNEMGQNLNARALKLDQTLVVGGSRRGSGGGGTAGASPYPLIVWTRDRYLTYRGDVHGIKSQIFYAFYRVYVCVRGSRLGVQPPPPPTPQPRHCSPSNPPVSRIY